MFLKQPTCLIHSKHSLLSISILRHQHNHNADTGGCANLQHSKPLPLTMKTFPEDIEAKYLAGLIAYSKKRSFHMTAQGMRTRGVKKLQKLQRTIFVLQKGSEEPRDQN